MPIIEEEIKSFEDMTPEEIKKEKSKVYTASTKGLHKTNLRRVQAYQREYWKKNWRKYAGRHFDRVVQCKPDEGDERIGKIKSGLKSHKNFPLRARVGLEGVKEIMREELSRRCELYKNGSKVNSEKKKILCIVGESGVGKTLASLHLKNKLGANVICSFTTRPPRETEVEGRDHHFVDIHPPKDELLAYVEFFGYEYYALKSQVYGDCTVYVIDEGGLRNLIEEHGKEYEIYSVYITRTYSNRLRTEIDVHRMNRDVVRKKLNDDFYDWIVENNSTKREFFRKMEEIYNEIKNK